MDNQLTQSQFLSLINSLNDGVIVTDEHQKVIHYNAAALSLLNSNTSLENQFIDKVAVLRDKNNKQVLLSKVIDDKKASYENRDLRIEYDDDSYIAVSVNVRSIYKAYKTKDSGIVAIIRDISKEKSLEEERDEFISVVSHELRTPITIAEGNISNAQLMISKGSSKNEIISALDKAHDQILFLSELINDLATLSRAERGKLGLSITTINVNALIRSIHTFYKQDALEKGIHFLNKIDPHLEALQSSELYVKEILQNLVTNAIKYTDNGSVTIGVRSKPDGIQFYVQDTGIGIKQAELKKIFDKFYRSEDYHTKEHRGTGLGLYITSKLCKLIDAKITVESQIGKGSTFILYVPNLQLHKK